MIYRNIKTGAEILSRSAIISPDYILVEEKAEKKGCSPGAAPIRGSKNEEPPIEEAPVKKEQPKKGRSAPKKKGTKK